MMWPALSLTCSNRKIVNVNFSNAVWSLHYLTQTDGWWVVFCSYCVQDFQQSERRVQETVENSLLDRGNSHLVHLQQIHHHFLVQLDQPLKDCRLKCRPPVSWCKHNRYLRKLFFLQILIHCLSHSIKKLSSFYLALSVEHLSSRGWIWQMGWWWSRNYFGQ